MASVGRRGLLSLIAGALTWAGLRPALAQDAFEAPFDPARLPFPAIKVAGRDALKRWEAIRAEGKVWPVVLGDALSCSHLLDTLSYDKASTAELIAAARDVVFPRDLLAKDAADNAAFLAELKAKGIAYDTEGEDGPEVGEWPARPEAYSPLGSIQDYRTNRPAPEVYIGLLPTTDGTTTPAWLKFGNWNACPPVEHQIAVLRSLRDRYGAEIVACTHDMIDLRVARRPKTREEALGLARELYVYCGDSVDQGHETLSRFAAALMASEWWSFWWD